MHRASPRKGGGAQTQKRFSHNNISQTASFSCDNYTTFRHHCCVLHGSSFPLHAMPCHAIPSLAMPRCTKSRVMWNINAFGCSHTTAMQYRRNQSINPSPTTLRPPPSHIEQNHEQKISRSNSTRPRRVRPASPNRREALGQIEPAVRLLRLLFIIIVTSVAVPHARNGP